MYRIKLLHVEDRHEDVVLLERACHAANLEIDFYEVSGGVEAIAYLKGEAVFADRSRFPLPDVIVLDLRMPGMNGFELLCWIKSQTNLGAIPVIIFTEAMSPEDKAQALAQGASGYFVKPGDFRQLVALAESFKHFRSPEVN